MKDMQEARKTWVAALALHFSIVSHFVLILQIV